MGLTGIEIFKLLPKTNCKECGSPTCLAFAMAVAAGRQEIGACPYASEELVAALEVRAPMATVVLGTGDGTLEVGGESVLFRHDGRFEHPTAIAVRIDDAMPESEVEGRLERFRQLRYEMLGLVLRPEIVAVGDASGDAGRFAGLVSRVVGETDAGVILMSEDAAVLAAGVEACGDRRPLLLGATAENADEVAAIAKGSAVAARAQGIEALADLVGRLQKAGVDEIVLDTGARDPGRALRDQVLLRRAVVNGGGGALGHPTIVLPCEMTGDPMMEALFASVFVLKYGGIVVLSDMRGETLYPLLLERLGIHSDPMKPLMAPVGIHEVGEPDEDSPVVLTSSWALTYLLLRAAVEASGVPAWICVAPVEEETDVLCWCPRCLRSNHPGRLEHAATREFLEGCGIRERVRHTTLLISGRSTQERDDLERALPGWEVAVGPADADGLAGWLGGRARESAG